MAGEVIFLCVIVAIPVVITSLICNCIRDGEKDKWKKGERENLDQKEREKSSLKKDLEEKLDNERKEKMDLQLKLTKASNNLEKIGSKVDIFTIKSQDRDLLRRRNFFSSISRPVEKELDENKIEDYAKSLKEFTRIKNKLSNKINNEDLDSYINALEQFERIKNKLNGEVNDEYLGSLLLISQEKFPLIQNSLEEAQKELIDEKENKEKLTEDLENLEQSKQTLQKDLEGQNKKLEGQVISTEIELSKIKEKSKDYEINIARLDERLNQTKTSLDKAEKKIEVLEKKKEELQKEENEKIIKLYEESSQHSVTKSNLQKSLERIVELGNKLEKWHNVMSEIGNDCEKLQEKKESLQKLLDSQISASEEDKNKLKKEINDLEKELSSKEEYVNVLKKELSEVHREIKDKKNEAKKAKEDLEKSETNHNKKIKELKNSLENLAIEKGKKQFNLYYGTKDDDKKQLRNQEMKEMESTLSKGWECLEEEIQKIKVEATEKIKLQSLLDIIVKLEKKEKSINVIINYYSSVTENNYSGEFTSGGAMLLGNNQIGDYTNLSHQTNTYHQENSQEPQSHVQIPPK